jgi:hypothetical protein
MSKKKIDKPLRDPDHHSKRGVPYWWAPEWVRGTSSSQSSFGKIAAVKEKDGSVALYMKSKTGSYSYIQGSIQREFQQWHTDRQIDYILLGIDPDELLIDESEAD